MESGGADWMGLALALSALCAIAYRWAGSKLWGIEDTKDDRGLLWVRRLAPAGAIVGLCVFAALGFARCS